MDREVPLFLSFHLSLCVSKTVPELNLSEARTARCLQSNESIRALMRLAFSFQRATIIYNVIVTTRLTFDETDDDDDDNDRRGEFIRTSFLKNVSKQACLINLLGRDSLSRH